MKEIIERRSIRKYKKDVIDRKDIEAILKAGIYAPSPYLGIDTDRRVSEICDTLSIGASVQNILLTATELGYGTLWIANTCFAYNELVELTGMKGQLVGAISLGAAAEAPMQRARKDFTEVVEFC